MHTFGLSIYDRDVAYILAIQSEIAQQVADQLRAKLSPSEKAAIAERPTADPVAYAYYTKAKETDHSENWEGMEKSLNQKVELLEKAIQRDPNFALAYCELAKTHIDFSPVAETEVHKHLRLAKDAAEAALRVRPNLARLIWSWLAITSPLVFSRTITTGHVRS